MSGPLQFFFWLFLSVPDLMVSSSLVPESNQRGILRARAYFFLHNQGPELLHQRIPNTQHSCFPHYHRNTLYWNCSTMTQSISQPWSSEKILFTVQGCGTWNYIPNCISPFPCPSEILNLSSSIVPCPSTPSFWLFMQFQSFILFCVRIAHYQVSSLHWVPAILLVNKGKMSKSLKGYNHKNSI